MSYDTELAERIRAAIGDTDGVVEKKMFGGLAFMVQGHMCCGIARNALMVRVGPEAYDDALTEPHARPMDFTGRPLRGMVYVDPPGYLSDDGLAEWVGRGLAFVDTLPPKKGKA